MPHDKSGQLIEVGDTVTVQFTVKSISTGEEYCNVGLETVEPMYPGDYKTALQVNARQVIKTEATVTA